MSFFLRWNLRNRLHKTQNINRWACLMISSQRPNGNQLSIAKQFVDQFTMVSFLEILSLKFHLYIDYPSIWHLLSIESSNEQ